jgi:hypothetical protein
VRQNSIEWRHRHHHAFVWHGGACCAGSCDAQPPSSRSLSPARLRARPSTPLPPPLPPHHLLILRHRKRSCVRSGRHALPWHNRSGYALLSYSLKRRGRRARPRGGPKHCIVKARALVFLCVNADQEDLPAREPVAFCGTVRRPPYLCHVCADKQECDNGQIVPRD